MATGFECDVCGKLAKGKPFVLGYNPPEGKYSGVEMCYECLETAAGMKRDSHVGVIVGKGWVDSAIISIVRRAKSVFTTFKQ